MFKNTRTPFETHLQDVQRFYEILDKLERNVGGKRTLRKADGGMKWPRRGMYIFFDPGEMRSTSGLGLRVTRTGTHAAGSVLWALERESRYGGL